MTGLDAHVVVDRAGFRLDATLTAAAGETVAVMGPSGAGKSTLLDVIAGMLRPDEGHVRVSGRELTTPQRTVPPRRRGVVLLGQDPHLFPHLDARANIAFGLRAGGLARSAALAAADSWLERVGLAGAGARRPRELSGGQQQRVALARALATEPDVLLLDEPLTALDPETASGVRAMLIAQLGVTTTVLVTHDAVDAAAIATRLVILESGRVTQDGPVREVLHAPATSFGATVAGLNRVVGEVHAGTWRAGGLTLAAPQLPDGPAIALFPPGAATLADGAWEARIERIEQTISGVRVRTADPAVAIDVPVEAVAARQLAAGGRVRVRIDETAVRLLG